MKRQGFVAYQQGATSEIGGGTRAVTYLAGQPVARDGKCDKSLSLADLAVPWFRPRKVGENREV